MDWSHTAISVATYARRTLKSRALPRGVDRTSKEKIQSPLPTLIEKPIGTLIFCRRQSSLDRVSRSFNVHQLRCILSMNRAKHSHSPAALATILLLPPRMISPTDIESERATPSIIQAHNVTPPRSCIIDEWLNKRIPITPDEIPSAAGEQRGDGRASHPRFGSTALVQPAHTRAARKGLSWPANATDLCGLGRRLSACKKISLACAPGDSYASSTHLIQCTARRSPDRRDGSYGRASERADWCIE